jgi:type II secretory pathway pseudopilin PulG
MKQTDCYLNRLRLSRGFTLIELMVASIATVAILAVAGFGLISIVGSRNTADASTIQRQNLNRALNYITDEVRSASTISLTGSTTGVSGFPTLPTGSQVVLVLTVPSVSNPSVSNPIVYYVAPAQLPWLGPNTLVRWGPDINTDGSYNTASYNSNVLIDSINTSGASTVCTSGLPVPSVANRKGFYACIDSSGKVADVFLVSLFTDTAGLSSSYSVTSRMYSRSVSKLPSS